MVGWLGETGGRRDSAPKLNIFQLFLSGDILGKKEKAFHATKTQPTIQDHRNDI